MFKVSTSGQSLGFNMISALSGTALTGLASLISGWKSVDGGSQQGISGTISEIGFGQYVANLYDWDTSGRIISYLFTGASGAIPVEKTVITTWNVSGALIPASGASVVSTPYSGSLSGQPITLLSGLSYIASGIWPASGASVNTTVASGSLYLASGSIFRTTFASGVVGGGSGNLPSAWGGSGAVTVGQDLDKSGFTVSTNLDKSGYTVTSLLSGLLSGQPVTLLSGLSYVASGIWPASGAFTSLVSGQVYIASGTQTLVYSGQLSGQVSASVTSGQVYLASGTNVLVYSGQLSGQVSASVTSGAVYLASGTNVLIYSGQLSGQATASLTSGAVYLASGTNVLIYSGQLSGQATASLTSGAVYLASGTNVLIYSGQLSGQATASLTSGAVYLASGTNVLVYSGQLSGQVSASVTSGAVYLASGSQVMVYSGQLSGQPIAGLSGQIYTASGIWSASGAYGNTTVASGSLYLASGSLFRNTFASGVLGGSGGLATAWGDSGAVNVGQNLDKSGYTVSTVASGILSGQPLTLLSGLSYIASGIWPASGAWTTTSLASGAVYLASGTNVLVYSGQLSGQVTATVTSGAVYLASGTNVLVYSGQLSGQPLAGLSGRIYPASGVYTQATMASGQVYLASGQQAVVVPGTLSGVYSITGTVLDKSGFSLAPGGVDPIQVENGLNLRQAHSIQAAALAGALGGAGTDTITIAGAGVATTRITANVTASGDRTTVTISPPA